MRHDRPVGTIMRALVALCATAAPRVFRRCDPAGYSDALRRVPVETCRPIPDRHRGRLRPCRGCAARNPARLPRPEHQSRGMLSAIHLASRGLQMSPRIASSPSGESAEARHLLTRREAEVLPSCSVAPMPTWASRRSAPTRGTSTASSASPLVANSRRQTRPIRRRPPVRHSSSCTCLVKPGQSICRVHNRSKRPGSHSPSIAVIECRSQETPCNAASHRRTSRFPATPSQ